MTLEEIIPDFKMCPSLKAEVTFFQKLNVLTDCVDHILELAVFLNSQYCYCYFKCIVLCYVVTF
jgi:hypothetical protein